MLEFLAFVAVICELGLFLLVWVALVRIIQRTGHSGWWGLTAFIPLVNVLMIWVLALAPWPALEAARRGAGAAPRRAGLPRGRAFR